MKCCLTNKNNIVICFSNKCQIFFFFYSRISLLYLYYWLTLTYLFHRDVRGDFARSLSFYYYSATLLFILLGHFSNAQVINHQDDQIFRFRAKYKGIFDESLFLVRSFIIRTSVQCDYCAVLAGFLAGFQLGLPVWSSFFE